MQHGSARPCAVKYINDHGRRHADQGCVSSCRFRLRPGSVAPEASSAMPSSRASSAAASIARVSSARSVSNSDDSGRARP